MSDLKTAYCGFPLLAAGQAQKEITHNEALTLADALISGAVEAGPLNAPPSAPTPGQMWIVGDNPSGVGRRQRGNWHFGHKADGVSFPLIRAKDYGIRRAEASFGIENQLGRKRLH